MIGALFAGFGNTMLFSSVEAEVNTPLMLPIMLCTWLAVVWGQSKDPRRDKILLLISYIAFLGIGIHMYSMIGLFPIFLYVVLVDREKLKDWRLWATSMSMGLVMYDISMFFWTGTSVIVVTSIMALMKSKNQAKWRLCLGVAAFAMLGFSVHLYIPIRSSLRPNIDENHPATVRSFIDYLDRKQYGSESMISRMLFRRGTWGHQFGIEGHMGFGGFFLTQFYRFSLQDTQVNFFSKGMASGMGKLLIYLLPAALMIFGWFYLYRRSRNIAILLITLTLATTIGMVLYMNFADGTRPEMRDYQMWVKAGQPGQMPVVHREVRVRDYFWVPGFFYYGMWIGLASGCVLLGLYSSRRKIVRTTLAPMVTMLLAVSPALPMTQNMPINNRRGDFIPYDYAYNLLMSVDPGGILFTNGDNDTFPLWALQEAFGVRTDVRIINLSLLNTSWYISQMKNLEPKVPIDLPESEINRIDHQLNPFEKPVKYHLPKADIDVVLPGRDENRIMKVQDKMVVHIVDANAWRKPIYFANTVSDENFMGLGPYLSMEGLVFRIKKTPVKQEDQFNSERTGYMIDHVYHFRNLDTWRARNDETTRNLVSNYSTLFLQIGIDKMNVARSLRREIDSLNSAMGKSEADSSLAIAVNTVQKTLDAEVDEGLARLDQCTKLIPWDSRSLTFRQRLLTSAGREKQAKQELNDVLRKDPDNIELLKLSAQELIDKGKGSEATELLKKLVSIDPNPQYALYALAREYQSQGKFDSVEWAMNKLQQIDPDNQDVNRMLEQLRMMNKKLNSGLNWYLRMNGW